MVHRTAGVAAGDPGRIVSDQAAKRAGDLERYLRHHIPISEAMGVRVVSAAENGVRLRAPLEPNINHRSTVFGGSAAAVAILSGWSLLHMRLSQHGHGARIVIQNSYVHYEHPIHAEFDAVALPPAEAAWSRFSRMLARKGRGRIEISVELEVGGERVGGCTGVYVVLPIDDSPAEIRGVR